MSDLEERVAVGMAQLAEAGLNLQALLPTASVLGLLPKLDPAKAPPTLLLLGSTGGRLWARLQEQGRTSTPDPIDRWCGEAVAAFRQGALAGTRSDLLWPHADRRRLGVVSLGEAVGWSHRSRMGIGIHPRHGLWFGYRAVLLIDGELRDRREAPTKNPCDSCAGTPCVAACPVGAVGGPSGLDVLSSFAERVRPGSLCGDRCLARLACPVGRGSRYPMAQIAHHQASAAKIWRRYEEGAPSEAPPEWRER